MDPKLAIPELTRGKKGGFFVHFPLRNCALPLFATNAAAATRSSTAMGLTADASTFTQPQWQLIFERSKRCVHNERGNAASCCFFYKHFTVGNTRNYDIDIYVLTSRKKGYI